MTTEEKLRETRFYVTLGLGYILLILGCLLPPLGVISNSVIFGAGILLALSAMIIGIDLTRVIKELRQLNREFQGIADDKKEKETAKKKSDKYNKKDEDEELDA